MRIPIRLYGGIAWEKREDDTALKTAHRVEPAITHFAISGAPITCEKYGHGHINCTYQVKTDDGHAYILQRINRYVFADPKAVMENVGAVTQYLRERAEDPHEVLNFIPADTGVYYHIDEAGEYWRCYEFADGICLEAPESDTDFYESAIAFGRFQEMLREFPAETLHETIPLFHNTTNRYRIFRKALQDDLAGRAAGVPDDIRFALDREQEAGTLCSLLDSGELPLRVTHNDTKLNNVLFDRRTRKALCVLDLDTVMPGSSLYDYGDSIRFGAATAAEDEKDLSKMGINLHLFQVYTADTQGAGAAAARRKDHHARAGRALPDRLSRWRPLFPRRLPRAQSRARPCADEAGGRHGGPLGRNAGHRRRRSGKAKLRRSYAVFRR